MKIVTFLRLITVISYYKQNYVVSKVTCPKSCSATSVQHSSQVWVFDKVEVDRLSKVLQKVSHVLYEYSNCITMTLKFIEVKKIHMLCFRHSSSNTVIPTPCTVGQCIIEWRNRSHFNIRPFVRR